MIIIMTQEEKKFLLDSLQTLQSNAGRKKVKEAMKTKQEELAKKMFSEIDSRQYVQEYTEIDLMRKERMTIETLLEEPEKLVNRLS